MKQTIINGTYQPLLDIINQLNIRKVMIVCGQSFKSLELSSYISGLDVEKVYFTDFTPNPVYEDVCKGVSRFKLEQCDALIAVGGGSPIDVAKCIKLFAGMDDSINYLEQTFEETTIPLIAIPTTAGSGSESTRFSVIYYNGVKQSVLHDSILPDYAVLIPSVLASLPLYQKKCTVLDALCQAIESCWSVNSTDESKGFATTAIKAIVAHAKAYVLENDAEAMEHIMLASNYAGRAINITLTTAPHAMSYKLTSMFGLPHGHSVAISLAEVWAYMLANPDKTADRRGIAYVKEAFQTIAEAMGCQSTEEALCWYRQLLVDLDMGLPVSVQKEADVIQLTASVNISRLNNNPIMLDNDALKSIYERIVQDEA